MKFALVSQKKQTQIFAKLIIEIILDFYYSVFKGLFMNYKSVTLGMTIGGSIGVLECLLRDYFVNRPLFSYYKHSPSNALNLSIKVCFCVNFYFAHVFNSSRAQYNLACMYLEGFGVKKNSKKFTYYFNKSLAQNSYEALLMTEIQSIKNNYMNTMQNEVRNFFIRKSKLQIL